MPSAKGNDRDFLAGSAQRAHGNAGRTHLLGSDQRPTQG
jgi:hypothetical protein